MIRPTNKQHSKLSTVANESPETTPEPDTDTPPPQSDKQQTVSPTKQIDHNEPDNNEPDNNEPDNNQPEHSQPEHSQPEHSQLGAESSLKSTTSPTPSPAEASRPLSPAGASRPPSPAGASRPDLIPVRMLNEFTYCPRLGYLEFVHGEWEDNLETKQGTFGHRRVDKPDRQNIAKADRVPPSDCSTSRGEHDSSATNDSPASVEATRLHARSIMLSAPDEGLVAKLDLLELDGLQATPVDYKRGRLPKVAEGAYEPERVQLCAQGLVLRENGFECNEGVLYFIASKKRVVIPFTDELIARTRQLRQQFGRAAAENVVPLPLVDSPKCPRCSLVGICLPDEVVFLKGGGEGFRSSGFGVQEEEEDKHAADSTRPSLPMFETNDLHSNAQATNERGACDLSATELGATELGEETSLTSTPTATPSPAEASRPPSPAEASRPPSPCGASGPPSSCGASRPPVRKLLPARDDATPFYVQEFGAMLGKSGDRLVVKKKGDVLGERRLKDVSQVSLFGGVIVSAQALSELMGRGISICHFSHGGWFYGITSGLVHKNVQLRIRQYQTAGNESQAVLIARQLISGKIRNCRTLLRRHLDSSDKPLLDKLDRYRRKAESTVSLDSLLGIEGMAAKEYFSGLFKLMRNRHDFSVNDRNRRPPRDPVNAVLSFAYALLTKELTITLQAVGFDPMLGLFHQPRYGRPSLALDLAEEYRPLIADSVMLTTFNNGELSSDRFLERAGAVTLTPAGRAAVISAFERRMNTEITHPIFGYRISYRRLMEVQSRLLARTLLGEIEEYPAFCTR